MIKLRNSFGQELKDPWGKDVTPLSLGHVMSQLSELLSDHVCSLMAGQAMADR